MSELRIYLLSIVFSFMALAPTQSNAEAETLLEQAQEFGVSHGCGSNASFINQTQYIVWIDFVKSVAGRLISEEVIESCPGYLRIFLDGPAASEIEADLYLELRQRLISKMIPASGLEDYQQIRVRQGYAAAEYVIAVYFICQFEASCFNEVLEKDEYSASICPTNSYADTSSPDAFELDLYKYGGDIRYFLPYLLTNCRLLEAAYERTDLTPIFDAVGQVIFNVR